MADKGPSNPLATKRGMNIERSEPRREVIKLRKIGKFQSDGAEQFKVAMADKSDRY